MIVWVREVDPRAELQAAANRKFRQALELPAGPERRRLSKGCVPNCSHVSNELLTRNLTYRIGDATPGSGRHHPWP